MKPEYDLATASKILELIYQKSDRTIVDSGYSLALNDLIQVIEEMFPELSSPSE
jgi:hypothetical protein